MAKFIPKGDTALDNQFATYQTYPVSATTGIGGAPVPQVPEFDELYPGTVTATGTIPGTNIYFRLYLPDRRYMGNGTTPRPADDPFRNILFPCIHTHTPYSYSDDTDTVALRFGRYDQVDMIRRGYAVLITDQLGTGASGGCWELNDPMHADHCKAICDWIRSQPWSNGKIGHYGTSQEGTWGLVTLMKYPNNSYDTTISFAPVMSTYQYIYADDGAVYGARNLGSRAYILANFSGPTIAGQATDHPELLSHLDTRLGCNAPAVADAAADQSGTLTTYWDNLEYWKLGSAINKPIFVAMGVNDSYVFARPTIDMLNLVPASTKMYAMIGQWDHDIPYNPTVQTGALSANKRPMYYASTAARKDTKDAVNAWADYYLWATPRLGPATVADGAVTQVPDWHRWHLHDDPSEHGGSVSGHPNSHCRGVSSFLEGTTKETLYLDRNCLVPAPRLNAASQSNETQTLMCFSPPVPEGRLIVGEIVLKLWVTLFQTAPGARDGNFVFNAHEWYLPGLFTTQPKQGAWPLNTFRGHRSARHRDSLSAPSDFPIGTPALVTIRSHPILRWVGAESRLRICIGGDDANWEVVDARVYAVPYAPTVKKNTNWTANIASSTEHRSTIEYHYVTDFSSLIEVRHGLTGPRYNGGYTSPTVTLAPRRTVITVA